MEAVLAAAPGVRAARDATRGGLATVLNEIAGAAGVGIEIDEAALPLRAEVKGVCEILGLDPLYLANEGKLVAVRARGRGRGGARRDARHAGRSRAPPPSARPPRGHAGTVVMRTVFGGGRIVDMLVGEQLPRIC